MTGTQLTVQGHGDDNGDGHGVMRVYVIIDSHLRYQSPPETNSATYTWTFQTSEFGAGHVVTIRTLDYAGHMTDTSNSAVAVASN